MTIEEAVKMLQVTRLMLMDGANQPISDLYYALDMAIEALEQTEPNSSEIPNNSTISKMEQVDWKDQMWAEAVEDEPQTDGYISGEDFMKIFDEPQTERSSE